MKKNNQKIWEKRYASGQVLNRYPFDMVVSFVMRNFAGVERNQICILDYGCGGGNHTIFLAQEGFKYYAIDYSSSAINHVKSRLQILGFKPDIDQLICQDFVSLPYENNFFDAIIDRQSLDQNNWKDIQIMVQEIHRVLKPGALYFGMNFSANDPNIKYGRHLGDGDYTNFIKGTFKGLGLRHFFSEAQVRKLFNQFELVDIKIKKIYSLVEHEDGSEEIIITARKPLNHA
jgi:ubiquinone/menaquinone biosynthesis C-methylase UbiE